MLAAIVVGGTSILGGEGAVWRSVVGVLLIAFIGNGYVLIGLGTRSTSRSPRVRSCWERWQSTPGEEARLMATTETAQLDAATARELYRRMLLIRGVEDRVQSLFLRGEVYGTTHLYSGQEAVAVGFASVLRRRSDRLHLPRPRAPARDGRDPEALLAELLGRETGVNGGRSGSMNMVDPERGVLGCYGIVGGSIAAATGAALALSGTGSVAVAYFGDGATNQAYFYECLNFAKVLQLPVRASSARTTATASTRRSRR